MPRPLTPETSPPGINPNLHYPKPPSKHPFVPPPGLVPVPAWSPGDGIPAGYDSVMFQTEIDESDDMPSGGASCDAREPELEPLASEEGGGHSRRELS